LFGGEHCLNSSPEGFMAGIVRHRVDGVTHEGRRHRAAVVVMSWVGFESSSLRRNAGL
jgi:hypothetical protein